MRPVAYETRCPECLCRVTIFDEWQIKKEKDKNGKNREIIWFDPDSLLHKVHTCEERYVSYLSVFPDLL